MEEERLRLLAIGQVEKEKMQRERAEALAERQRIEQATHQRREGMVLTLTTLPLRVTVLLIAVTATHQPLR